VTEAAPDSVKSFGDFAHILAGDQPDVWKSHRPAKGGVTGKMLAEIIDQAAALKANGDSPRPRRGRTTDRKPDRKASKPSSASRRRPASTTKSRSRTK
jgi:hypothetical protein